jgi:cell division protein FtsB
MQYTPRRKRRRVAPQEGGSPNVTAAVGLGESAGLARLRRGSLFTRTIIWATGLICLSLLLGTFAQAWSNDRLMQQVALARAQYQQALARHTTLQKLVDYYKDPFVIESEARQRLGYVRPGEHRVVIVSTPQNSPPPRSPGAAQPTTGGFWQDWWNAFFGS